jgi:SAM-dependent methyltransferase
MAPLDPEAVFSSVDAQQTPYLEYALVQRLLRLARLRPMRRVLDFGCGSGHLLGLARRVLGWETYGVDLDPVAALGARRFGFVLHGGPLETAPFEPGSFDLVYAAQVLEHLPEPRSELAFAREFLAPGGLLFVELPNYESLSIRLGRDDFVNNRPPGHLNYFGRAPLCRLLVSCGLELVTVRTTGIAYRALLGFHHTPQPVRDTSAVASPAGSLPRVGLPARLKLRVLHALDTLQTFPGWGVQLEAVARRPD